MMGQQTIHSYPLPLAIAGWTLTLPAPLLWRFGCLVGSWAEASPAWLTTMRHKRYRGYFRSCPGSRCSQLSSLSWFLTSSCTRSTVAWSVGGCFRLVAGQFLLLISCQCRSLLLRVACFDRKQFLFFHNGVPLATSTVHHPLSGINVYITTTGTVPTQILLPLPSVFVLFHHIFAFFTASIFIRPRHHNQNYSDNNKFKFLEVSEPSSHFPHSRALSLFTSWDE